MNNQDLNLVQNILTNNINLIQKLKEKNLEKRLDDTILEMYHQGRADAYEFVLLQLRDLDNHINTLKEINDGITGERRRSIHDRDTCSN